MVVDKFLFFCFDEWFKNLSCTLNFCLEEWFINLLIHAYQYKILLRIFHHFSFHSCCSYWILIYFRFVSHFSIFRCVLQFSIFRFVAFRFAFQYISFRCVAFRNISFRFVVFRNISFRCVSISFRSLVQPIILHTIKTVYYCSKVLFIQSSNWFETYTCEYYKPVYAYLQ